MDTHIDSGNDRVTQSKRVPSRGKPSRKVSTTHISYEGYDIIDIQFRWDSVCAIIRKTYPKISAFQMKVMLSADYLMRMTGDVCTSYQQIDTSGLIRGMNWQAIQTSLEWLHDAGLLETMGRTKGNRYYRYCLSGDGDVLVRWARRELSDPRDVLMFQSTRFDRPQVA